MTRLDALLLFTLGLALRLPLVFTYPAVHGGDSVLRLARSDTLILGLWLPLPQLVVFMARAVAPDPVWTRLAFVLAGSLVALALAWVVAATAGRAAGCAAGVLGSLHPLLAYYSLVPYQESLMLLLLLAGAGSLLRGNAWLASLTVGLACLCRYEAWIAAALIIAARWRAPLRALALFGWAPLLWVAAWRGLAPAGSYVLDTDRAAGRLSKLPFLFAKLREYSGDTLLLLALAGAIAAAWRRPRRWAWGAAFLVIFLAAQFAIGLEHPPGSGRLNERMAHVPALALCALGGLALGSLSERLTWRSIPLGAAVTAALLAGLGLRWAHRVEALVAEANRDPSLRLAVDVARFAHLHLPPGGRLAVAAPPVEPQAIDAYIRKVEAAGGDVARARALGIELASHSPDLDRIAAHLPRPPGTAIRAGRGVASLVAVFDDAPDAAVWRSLQPLVRFTAGSRAVAVYPGEH